MGFKARDIKPLATREALLAAVSPEDIFHHYLNGLPTKPIRSPLRDDKVPSFSLFYSDMYNQLFWKDFATGESGDCFVFVKRLHKCKRMNDVFNQIVNDMMLTQFQLDVNIVSVKNMPTIAPKEKKVFKKIKYDIKIKIRKWNIKDKEFWYDKYGLSIVQLEYSGVFPISHYFLNEIIYKTEGIAYSFVERKDGVETFKIYQPFSVYKKWINNNNFSTWELWTQLPSTGKSLIITSSRKDAMVIKALFKPSIITSCALQSEGVWPKLSVVEELKSRFQKVYIMYDNDFYSLKNPGHTFAAKIAHAHDLIQIEVPFGYQIKDPSDFRHRHGSEQTKDLILGLIKQTK